MSTIQITYVSDYVCPYCYAARTALLEAVKDYDVEINWLPYEATPINQPQVDTYHDPVRKQKYRKIIAPMIRELGLDMKLPPKVIPRPYTRLATEGHYFADEHGRSTEYDTRVLQAYYAEEQNIGKLEILTQLAKDAGLDAETFAQALSSGTYTNAVQQAEDYVQQTIHPKQIPTILIGNNIRLDGGVYSVQQLKAFLEQAASEQDEQVTLSGAGCGENGCGF
ncbi:MAG: DsbA family protein [Clostridia bacterium]|nr:DsbA family protein [Clostridia bacterium]